MDTNYVDFSDQSLPIALLEMLSHSDVGPYDDDYNDPRQYSSSVQGVGSRLNMRKSQPKRQPKPSQT
jgi:hypothetical protein